MRSNETDVEMRIPRFRPAADWFVVRQRGRIVECVVWSTAERLLRVYLSLLDQLEPAVDVAVESVRDSRRWLGELLPLSDVRAAVTSLQRALVMHGGVELSVYTPDDQLTITPAVGLVIYARSDRWVYLLDAMGFAELPTEPASDWDADGSTRQPAPALDEALEQLAEQLDLQPA